MPRFESDERFWEIEREGRRLRIRSGWLGEVGELVGHVAHYEAEARREYDDRIRRKLVEGYRPARVPSEPLLELDAELAASVLAARTPEPELGPDARAAIRASWAVLGDWLAARGDVRGELIALDETLDALELAGPERDRLLGRREALLAEWVPRWFGELGPLEGASQPIGFGWDHGFITVARFGVEPQRLDLARFRLGLRDLVPVIERIVEHPAMLVLRELRLAELDPRGRRDLGRALAVVAGAPRPALERLELGGVSRGEWVLDEWGTPRQRSVWARIGSLASLARAPVWAPRLSALRMLGRELQVLPALPQLRQLELMVPAFTEELRRWLATSPWPRLERLWLRAGSHDPWARVPLGPSLEEILDSLGAGPLRELGIQGATGLEVCLNHPRLAPLRLQELRVFGLGDAVVDLLLAHHPRLASVDRIVIEDDEPGPRYAELARRFGPRLGRCRGLFSTLAPLTGVEGDSLFDLRPRAA